MIKNTFYITLFSALLCSCSGGNSQQSLAEGASGDIVAYENTDLNAAEQARATIMIIPSDNLLKNFKALEVVGNDGAEQVTRNYSKYLLSNKDNKAVISTIQQAFADANYPVQDLEQMLKQLSTQEATDLVDDIDKDAKTQLLTVAQPDIIIELDYQTSMNMRGAVNNASSVGYTLNVIDAYTNNVLSSTTMSDLKGENTVKAISGPLKEAMPKILGDIQKNFSDILTRGRNVTIRVAVGSDSNVNLNDESIEGDTYADWIMDYVKTHTVKGAYKMQRNTDKELYFTNCRIPLLNEDGTQYGVYDWAREMSKSMRKNLGVKCTNKAQGLGEILITINGIQ
ncbi:MAG: hypothetical protein K2L96_05505 [Muribaculaceae bacterium]|nr:hypothetical protein [Muribaculaceae bacterium]